MLLHVPVLCWALGRPKLYDSKDRAMKKLKRTTMTWRFVNSIAPTKQNYLPTKVCEADLVEVTATMFRNKATITIWFEALSFVLETHQGVVRSAFAREFQKLTHELGVDLDYGDDDDYSTRNPVCANGSCIWMNLKFNLRNGESFTHTCMQKFVKLVTLIGQKEWRERYHLPHPQVVQETMVEAYSRGNWIPYGQYLGDMFQSEDTLAPKPNF